MGIPSYFAHIVRNHRKIIKQLSALDGKKMNNLYLDCNSFIYEAHQIVHGNQTNVFKNIKGKNPDYKTAFENEIIKQVVVNLSKCIREINPDKRIFIAFDGVAPMAKLDQQRNRRYMTAFQEQIKPVDITERKNDNYHWNRSAITPGTNFMHNLGIELTKRFSNPSEYGVDIIIVSTSEEAGEGEHKLYDYIRDNAEFHKDTNTLIYGIDADLIMLSINHLHISENIFLYRETPEFIKSIDKTLNPNEKYVLDIPLLAKHIISELSNEEECKNSKNSKECKIGKECKKLDITAISLKNNIIFDYIFICFFLGNDFLPHFPALNIRTNGIANLVNAYKHVFQGTKETLTVDREINWKNVRKYVEHLATNEHDFIKEEYVYRTKMSKRARYESTSPDNKQDENLLLPIKERAIELYINPSDAGWETRYYRGLFQTKINDERRKEISTNYLEGLEWTMKYYSTGCADWRWSYNYYYPPLLTDLVKYIPYSNQSFIASQPKKPVSPLTQLSYVLPPSSMELIPSDLRERLLKELSEWYVGNYVFIWSFCKFFWEAHVDLPHIDIDLLEKIVKS
jgi:5'-3' exoribonuclease 1